MSKKTLNNVFQKFKGDIEEKKSTSTRSKQSTIELGKRKQQSTEDQIKKLQSESKFQKVEIPKKVDKISKVTLSDIKKKAVVAVNMNQ